jgi:14-3-3 protein epsilon
LEIYDKTYEKSKEKLSKVDPIRLGIALSFSTLYNEILNKPQKACGLARKAF